MTEEVVSPQPDSQNRPLTSTAWKPVAIVSILVLGGALLLNPSWAKSEETIADGATTFNDTAFMGGVKRHNASSDFRGGKATAFMGGVNIDLREAQMDRPEAILDVSSVMGGVEIRVPHTWTVISRVNTIMGGFEDTTKHPKDQSQRLVLVGDVIMGGIKVRN